MFSGDVSRLPGQANCLHSDPLVGVGCDMLKFFLAVNPRKNFNFFSLKYYLTMLLDSLCVC